MPDLAVPITTDTEAHLLALNLPAGRPLVAIAWEAVANDVIFGLMGASVLR